MEKVHMKVFDVHIGVSDGIILTGKDVNIKNYPNGIFPSQFDFVRAKEGELSQFCGMICPIVFNGTKFTLPLDAKKEILKHLKIYKSLQRSKLFNIILGLEGIYFLKNDEDLLFMNSIIKQGIRIIGPMWNFENNLFYHKKLTPLGKKLLYLCEKNDIILDLAHSESSVFQILVDNYRGRIINSHTNCMEIFPHKRNSSLHQLSQIVKRRGIIGLSFVGEFLGGNSMECILKTITFFNNNFGDDNLCIGSDFDGMEKSDLVNELEDVSKYQNLAKYLKKNGVPQKTIRKVFFTNANKFFSR